MNLIDLVVGARQDKKDWYKLQKRIKKMPADYRFVYQKMMDYMFNYAGGSGMETVRLLEDLADLFEEGAADGRPVRDIIGDDPAEFCDELIRNARSWTADLRKKLNTSIAKKLGDDSD